jgi:NADPH:quinone reductase-like Zn-dependent oxidoreductase
MWEWNMPRIVLFDEFGGPEVLRLTRVDSPVPGPGEVRVKVGAIGLNRAEVLFRRGSYLGTSFPSKIGLEAAGVVDAVGPDVVSLVPGERVAALTGLSMEQYGTCGEEMIYPADMLVKIADGQSFADAAACWMQYVTAYALVSIGAVSAGDAVVITAASSSVGIAAIQIANAHGAIPIAVTRGRDKAVALQEAGAHHVIVSDEDDVSARIREITAGKGARIAFDAVGGATICALVSAMAPQAIIIAYGVLAGPPAEFPLVSLLANNLTLRGWSADMLTRDPALRADVIAYVSKGLATGTLRPIIDRCFDLSEIVEAYCYLESNAQFGKVIVTTDLGR